MEAQSFGRQKNDQQDELARLRAFLVQVENEAYALPASDPTRAKLLALAHEARGLKPDPAKAQRVIITE